MEENQYIRKEYKTFSEIIGDSFRVLGENLLTYIVIFITIAILGGALSAFDYVLPGNNVLKHILSLVNAIAGSIIAIIYVGTTYNTLNPNKQYALGDLMGSKIIPMLLTQLLLIVILFIPTFLGLAGIMFALMSSGGYTLVMPVTIIFMIVIVGLSIKFAFLPQSIILSDQSYWQGIKWSWQKTSGHLGMIIGIGLMPAILGLVVFFLSKAGMMTLPLTLIFSIVSAALGVVVTLAISVLYIDVVLDENDDSTEEVLIYGGDF